MVLVYGAPGKIVKRFFGGFNDMARNKGCSFSCALFGTFDAAFPFHYRPDIAAVFGQFGKNGFKNLFVRLLGIYSVRLDRANRHNHQKLLSFHWV